MCQFTQQIVPQMNLKDGAIWNLNRKFFVIGATGSAQHDEVNAHDLSIGSHFYPVISPKPVDPSMIGERLFDLPSPKFRAAGNNTTARVVHSSASPTRSLLHTALYILLVLAFTVRAVNRLA